MDKYQVKVRYTSNDGKIYTETNVVFGIGFGDVEASITGAYQYDGSQKANFSVEEIKKVKISDIVHSKGEDKGALPWFYVVVMMLGYNEATQKETKQPYNVLVEAKDVDEAGDMAKDLFKIVDFYIKSIKETNIIDIVNEPEKLDFTIEFTEK